jgi:hypothetical protein
LIQYPDLFAQFTNFLNNSPNATQEDKEVALRMVVEAPTNPIANLAARLNCFNTSGNLNMTHKITLHVDQPDANSNKSATSKELAGHTFLTLEQDQGGQNGTVRLSAGLYPANSATFCDQIDPGAFNNDEGHDFDVSVTWEISGYAFTQMVNDMKTHPFAPLYNLSSNNCTTWTVDKLEKAGIYVPRTNVVSLNAPSVTECRIEGLTPGQLGQDLRNQYPLPSGATKNVTGGNASSSTCQ